MTFDVSYNIWIGLMIFFFLFVIATSTSDRVWQKEAAQTQCAHFHPETGKFEWIEQ